MLNKAILIGRLTKDPEVKYTQSGTAVCTFTLAVDRKFAKKDSGQPTADFIPIVAWRKLAEIIGNNLVKGRRISVEGRIQVRSYDAQDGSKRYATEIVADEVEFLDSKEQTGAQSATGGNGSFGSTVPDDEIPF